MFTYDQNMFGIMGKKIFPIMNICNHIHCMAVGHMTEIFNEHMDTNFSGQCIMKKMKGRNVGYVAGFQNNRCS